MESHVSSILSRSPLSYLARLTPFSLASPLCICISEYICVVKLADIYFLPCLFPILPLFITCMLCIWCICWNSWIWSTSEKTDIVWDFRQFHQLLGGKKTYFYTCCLVWFDRVPLSIIFSFYRDITVIVGLRPSTCISWSSKLIQLYRHGCLPYWLSDLIVPWMLCHDWHAFMLMASTFDSGWSREWESMDFWFLYWFTMDFTGLGDPWEHVIGSFWKFEFLWETLLFS